LWKRGVVNTMPIRQMLKNERGKIGGDSGSTAFVAKKKKKGPNKNLTKRRILWEKTKRQKAGAN